MTDRRRMSRYAARAWAVSIPVTGLTVLVTQLVWAGGWVPDIGDLLSNTLIQYLFAYSAILAAAAVGLVLWLSSRQTPAMTLSWTFALMFAGSVLPFVVIATTSGTGVMSAASVGGIFGVLFTFLPWALLTAILATLIMLPKWMRTKPQPDPRTDP